MRLPILFTVAIGYLAGFPMGLAPATASPAYVGTQVCAQCHVDEMADWKTSHHAKAWTEPSETTVEADFDNSSFTHNGRTSRFFKKDGSYFVETSDVVNRPKVLKIVGVAGFTPLQQYLVETDGGRLQSLDIVWDVMKKEWYHLYPEQLLPPEDAFHWTGLYKNWNGRCAECHATDYQKNYSPRTRTYSSTQSEIGVGCEACHGPGEAHVVWAEGGMPTAQSPFPGTDDKGLLLSFADGSAETEMQQCAGCHSRREPFGEGNPLPGTPYHDSYRLSLLREGLYHPDGQILDEVYVYGSFLQSKMYAKGVTCSDCHDPHGTTLKAEGNGICTQCHSPAGNPEFPTLAQREYDDPSHHFHTPGEPGSDCKSCHMIERTYMGVDGRRDHSFRVPRPDMSVRIGTPNACTDCHTDQTAEWAAAEIELRYPDSVHRGAHYGDVFSAARNEPGRMGEDLFALASTKTYPAIVRATALELLAREQSVDILTRAAALVDDEHPVVREAAVALAGKLPEAERLAVLVGALSDPIKAVRIAAARQIIGTRLSPLNEAALADVRKGTGEWQASLAAKSDFPETHMVLGGTALTLRNTRAAISAFREVTVLDPQMVDAWTFLIRTLMATGDMGGAQFALQQALGHNPNAAPLQELKQQFQAN